MLPQCCRCRQSLATFRASPKQFFSFLVLAGGLKRQIPHCCVALSTASMSVSTPRDRREYVPPSWATKSLRNAPRHGRLSLANLPTPVHRIELREKGVLKRLRELDISLYIKRDDMTGSLETGGNKIRKLEFLLADALAEGYDSVVTIGGEQSNHCRATASAARMLGLEPHLILRTRRANSIEPVGEDDFGYTGNVLIDRMMGSTIYTCTPGEYGRVGSQALVERVCQYIQKENAFKKPYEIPVGGSNALGSWGYIEGVDELMLQLNGTKLDHVVFACGSGGTATGITLGLAMAHSDNLKSPSEDAPTVHAIGVCDDPDYFYKTVSEIADNMGLTLPESLSTEDFVRRHLMTHQGKGLGYAASTQEELDFITAFTVETGIVLDPVYSGKALYHFISSVLEQDPESFRGCNLLFWHTGGALGMFDKGDSLLEMLSQVSPVKRLDVYGKGEDGTVTI